MPGGARMLGLPAPKLFERNLGLSSGAVQRNGGTDHDHPEFAIHSGMPLGMLCRAVQELHRCLTSMIKIGNLLDHEMLDVAEKDPMAPASKGRALSLMPRAEPLVSVTTLSEPSASEPEEAAPPEELTLVPTQRPLPSPGFSLPWMDGSDLPQPEQADWPMNVHSGAQLDFASLWSIQVIISHFPVMGEVHCEYQSQTIALMSLTWEPLQLAQVVLPDQLDSEEEL